MLAVTNMYPTPRAPGMGTFVHQQVEGLRRVGADVDVLFLDRIRHGRKVYAGLTRRLHEASDGRRHDVVHVMYGGVMAERVTRNAAVPTVVSFCGSDLLGEPFFHPLRRLSAEYGVIASRKAARRAAGVVVKSSRLRDALPKDLDPTRAKVIPNGIDLDRFRPLDRRACRQRLGWDEDTFHVLFSSVSGSPVKRPGLAAAAVRALARRGVKVTNHEMTGVPHDDVPVWINASDVVLLTSTHEGSPNIVKEALACDTPVVAVDVGDVAESIEGLPGAYVARADPDDLAAKLERVHGGPRRVEGRGRVEHLALERVARRLHDFYAEVAG